MDYLKIAALANRCEVQRAKISEYYRMIGANAWLTDVVKDAMYEVIRDMETELKTLENKLRKLVK